jgi:hypothetical protein
MNASEFFEQDRACPTAEPGDQNGTINATWIVSKVNDCTAVIHRPDLATTQYNDDQFYGVAAHSTQETDRLAAADLLCLLVQEGTCCIWETD